MFQKEWLTAPILQCLSLDDTLAFWGLLGYKTTYYQNRPYKYGVVERECSALHFVYVKGLQPGKSYSGCLVTVKDAAALYATFTQSLRTHTGKVPAAGLPRISKMKPGATRFSVTDPSGNSVIFVTMGEADTEVFNDPEKEGLTPLQKAIALAIRLRDFKEDPAAAAKVLDTCLKKAVHEMNIDLAHAYWIRRELVTDPDGSDPYQVQLKQIRLSPGELTQLQAKLHISEDITHFFAD